MKLHQQGLTKQKKTINTIENPETCVREFFASHRYAYLKDGSITQVAHLL